jgi:hypothetical protein
MSWARPAVALAVTAALAAGCARPAPSPLRARRVALEREVQGLAELVAELESGRPLLPEGRLVVAVHERLVRDILGSALPWEAELGRFRARLDRADVRFSGRYGLLSLEGAVASRSDPDLSGELRVLGGFESVALDPGSGTLRAALAVDHIDVRRAAGLEGLLSASALDDLARQLRIVVKQRLPSLEIPVELQQRIALPPVTEGPVRMEGAALPLTVAVSRVAALEGRLWVAFDVQPGAFQKAEAPAPGATGP